MADLSNLNSFEEFEKQALRTLPQCVKDYYNSGEGEEFTIRWNRQALKKYRIIPRVLRNVSKRDITTTVLGEKVSMPIGISPTAFHKLAHPDGETGTARAAKEAGIPYVLSTYANSGIQEVAEASPSCLKWLQIIISKDRDLTLYKIKKAEEFGYKALVLIVDIPIYGSAKSSSLKLCLEKYFTSGSILEDYISTKSDLSAKYSNNLGEYFGTMLDDSLTWEDVTWLKNNTKLPIILKGILSAEDAKIGVEYGASAIWVSNHGGRQLDYEPATIEVLPDIIKAVGDKVDVFMDGGITKGTDVFKALALGAKMVFLGKSMLWSLACGGEKGTQKALQVIRDEFERTLALTGCSSLEQIKKDMIVHESYYNR